MKPASALASGFAAAPPRTRALLVAGAVAAAILMAVAEDPILATAGRASLVALALGAAALLVRPRGAVGIPLASMVVAERRHLSRDAAVALLRIGGREFLVGYGHDGVRLLANLGRASAPDHEPLP